jgi:hypothetical protein
MTKAPFDPRVRYEQMKQQLAAGRGLTASEWTWFDNRMLEWEPDEYQRRRDAAKRRIAIEYFEKHLAPVGYVLIAPPQGTSQ